MERESADGSLTRNEHRAGDSCVLVKLRRAAGKKWRYKCRSLKSLRVSVRLKDRPRKRANLIRPIEALDLKR